MLPFTVPITVTRPAPGEFVDGRWLGGESTALTIDADVQPIRGRELMRLTEAQRVREPIRIYSETELRTADQVTRTTADVVTWKGRLYEVGSVEDWSDGDLPHFKALGLLIQPPPAPES